MEQRCRIPYAVVVKKHYPNRRRVAGRRKWKLQQLAKVTDGGITKREEEKAIHEYEAFMRDLEEDPDLRATINLYRDESVAADAQVPLVTDEGEAVEDDFPEVELHEMLQALTLDEHDPALAAGHSAVGHFDVVDNINVNMDM